MMQITEPVTTLTDYALGAANLYFALATYNGMHPGNRVTGLLLLLGYLAEAISALAGGTFHGFATYLERDWLQRLWNLTMVFSGATVAFLAGGIHAASVRREHGLWIVAGVATAVAGLCIQATGFRARQPFNHNDVFHIIIIAAMYLFFVGARNLRDRGYSPR